MLEDMLIFFNYDDDHISNLIINHVFFIFIILLLLSNELNNAFKLIKMHTIFLFEL